MIAWRLVNRHFVVYRRDWLVFLTGFLEPVLYLLSIGIGVGAMIPVSYTHLDVYKRQGVVRRGGIREGVGDGAGRGHRDAGRRRAAGG